MSDNKVLSYDEKLALATKIMGQIELARPRDEDGFDVIIIITHLLFPGHAVNLRICNPIQEF